jgi:hypothetical protein
MVLPGIQALFGFQLIAVFNSTFHERLNSIEQLLHLIAIALIAIAVALVMAPAALHRQTSPNAATQDFVTIASRLLLMSMFPLVVAISLDFYLIARLILNNNRVSMLLASGLLVLFTFLWFLLPRVQSLQKIVSGER